MFFRTLDKNRYQKPLQETFRSLQSSLSWFEKTNTISTITTEMESSQRFCIVLW